MAHMPANYLEEGGVGEEEEEEGLSLWSCIKNRLRRKKCTCHLNNIGENFSVGGNVCNQFSPQSDSQQCKFSLRILFILHCSGFLPIYHWSERSASASGQYLGGHYFWY